MSDIVRKWGTQEREYIEYKDKFRKRSRAPNEYNKGIRDPDFYSSLHMRRLQNEAACLEFIARDTSIPVPRLLAAYEHDGSFILETERIHGVLMQDLTPAEQSKVKPQIRHVLKELHSLRSDKLGGPSGLICPPQAVFCRPGERKTWLQAKETTFETVFCHRDLSQSNLYFRQDTLELVAIGDWEYGGFYPANHELPFFESPKKSGVQAKTINGINEIMDFWTKAACGAQEIRDPKFLSQPAIVTILPKAQLTTS